MSKAEAAEQILLKFVKLVICSSMERSSLRI